jgi:hypothetical protein
MGDTISFDVERRKNLIRGTHHVIDAVYLTQSQIMAMQDLRVKLRPTVMSGCRKCVIAAENGADP